MKGKERKNQTFEKLLIEGGRRSGQLLNAPGDIDPAPGHESQYVAQTKTH